MIQPLRAWLRTWWPALRLRAILLTVLLFAAAMPAIGAVFLRTYENTLVRQTEAELTSQGAALAAANSSTASRMARSRRAGHQVPTQPRRRWITPRPRCRLPGDSRCRPGSR